MGCTNHDKRKRIPPFIKSIELRMSTLKGALLNPSLVCREIIPNTQVFWGRCAYNEYMITRKRVRGTRMDLFQWAIALQILLFIYFEVTTLVDLYPWNDLRKYSLQEKLLEATVNGFIILTAIALFVTNIKWLMILSVIIWLVHFVMQLLTWWMPYLTGKHLKQFSRTLYDAHFRETIKILPPIKDHIIPDAQHNVLQLLSLITLVLSTLAIGT